MLDPALLALLVCPETRQALRPGTPEEIARLGLPEALVREDGAVAYPVQDGIPLLIAEEARPLPAA